MSSEPAHSAQRVCTILKKSLFMQYKLWVSKALYLQHENTPVDLSISILANPMLALNLTGRFRLKHLSNN